MSDPRHYAALVLSGWLDQHVPREWFAEAVQRVSRAAHTHHSPESRRTIVLKQLMTGLHVSESDARLLCELAVKYLKVTPRRTEP